MEYLQAFVYLLNIRGLGSNINIPNTEASLFSLLGRSFTLDGLGKVIYEYAAKSNRVGYHNEENAARFRNQLISLTNHIKEFKGGTASYGFSHTIF